MDSSPKLIIVGGSIATGKTTVSKFLTNKTGYMRIALDEIKEALFDVGGYKDRAWSKEIGAATHPVFRQLIQMYLSRGESVIADATFIWAEDRIWLQEFSSKYNAELIQIWMTADPQIARQRFIERSLIMRHPGHCDSIEAVISEFDERYFSKRIEPLLTNVRTYVMDTTDGGVIDHKNLMIFLDRQ
jgi:predicted kinase